MPRWRYRLTPELQGQIVSYLRAGGSPPAAAEAVGLPRQVFERWLERGRRPHAPPTYRAFAQAVMEAHAQARLHAEVTTLKGKPLDWLKVGPCKAAAQPGAAPDRERDGERSPVELFSLIGQCADCLSPHPEARVALATRFAECKAAKKAENFRKMSSPGMN